MLLILQTHFKQEKEPTILPVGKGLPANISGSSGQCHWENSAGGSEEEKRVGKPQRLSMKLKAGLLEVWQNWQIFN